MSITLINAGQVITRYPDFKTISSDIIEFAIQEAAMFTNSSVWLASLEKARMAQLFIVAHKLTSEWLQTAEIASAAAGLASGQSGGASSGGYGASDFESTHYGRQYLALKKTLLSTPIFVT